MDISGSVFENLELREFTAALANIVATVAPERVICLGVRTNRFEQWSAFKSQSEGYSHVTIDLLIVIGASEKRLAHEIHKSVVRYNSETLHLNAVVHGAGYVRKAVEKGNYFFSTAHRNGVQIYESHEAQKFFAPPWNNLNSSEAIFRMEKHWSTWFGLAQLALSEAEAGIERGEYVLSTCLLQQAAEYTCVVILRIALGYKPPMHNLRQLIELAVSVSTSVSAVFPRTTKEEKALFDALQNALAYTRYKEGYTVSAFTARILAERVEELQNIATVIYSERMAERAFALVGPEAETADAGGDGVVLFT